MRDKDTVLLEGIFQTINETGSYYKQHTYYGESLTVENNPNVYTVQYSGYWQYSDDSDYDRETGYGFREASDEVYKNEELSIEEYAPSSEKLRGSDQIEEEDPDLYNAILSVARERSDSDGQRFTEEL